MIDYVVTKVPRWAFEKLPGTSGVLGTQMQSVGEVMAIGRTFPESLQKALRSLEQGRLGLNADPAEEQYAAVTDDELLADVAVPTPERIFHLGELLRRGASVEQLHGATGVDPWFLDQMLAIVEEREHLAVEPPGRPRSTGRAWRRAKRLGFSDAPAGPPVADHGRRRPHGAGGRTACGRRTRRSTPAPPSSPPRRRTTTRRGRTPTRCARRTGPAWSSSARGRTASVRASSSTTAASTPASRCGKRASRR